MSARTSTNLPQPTPDEQAEQRACIAALSAWLMAADPEDHSSRLLIFSAGWAHGRAYERAQQTKQEGQA